MPTNRPFAALLVALCAMAASSPGLADSAKPREIVIESTTPPAADGSVQKPPPATEEEQRAQDNAYGAGAVDVDQTLHMTEESRKLDREISVRGGRCYSLSLAWRSSYRATITYTLGRAADGRQVNDFFSTDSGLTAPREGVVQFCTDRSGPVRLEVLADEGAAQAEAVHEYVLVIGSRLETAPQKEARRRRASGQRGLPVEKKSGAATSAWKPK